MGVERVFFYAVSHQYV